MNENSNLCKSCTNGITVKISDTTYECIFCNEVFSTTPRDDNLEECFSCKSTKIITDNTQGVICCTTCGLIQEHIISTEKHWNNYTAGKDNSTVGLVDNTNPFSTPGSTIPINSYVKASRDGNEYNLNLYKVHISSSYTSQQKSHDCVAKVINDTSMPSSIKKTAVAFWAAMLTSDVYKTHRNTVRDGVNFCCIYYACMYVGIYFTRNEITRLTGIKQEYMNKGDPIFREIISHTQYAEVIRIEPDITSAFERYMGMFNIDENRERFKYAKICRNIFNDYCEFLENRHEDTILSGIMSFVFEKYPHPRYKKIKISEVHNATHVSIPTINNLVVYLKSTVENIDHYRVKFK